MFMNFINAGHVMPTKRLYNLYVICLTLLNLILVIHCKACNNTEYEVGGECCSMCNSGHHVSKHCHGNSETVCNPCPNSTYTDVPNGLMACLICTVCDEGHGLMVKSNCISVSDAVCEPLPQHYCLENHGKGCRNAREHSTCLPGQYIKQTGTALEDTVCKDCSDETYSDGSLMQCKPHKNCESLGQMTVTQGTRSSDAMCGQESSHLGLIVGILLSALLVIVIAIVILLKKKKKFTI
ncbi:tumor necrosis factor receptor superfamily member 14-like [Silurus meridionalis]|uniref:tumor necrosis factor receptor superfamily member 14-like n=1 Tax=Silurus meridionalis TaxID=175797 RepID=UPI001EEBEC7C|nr:tumor necrosis factor receptor superfamily member 14-like [Silurus meridionalis]